ncbi:hypothetical protein QEJ31_00685 [Pigmentibacter sp. JX0631]|uniref:hypothetical protein n=1 Tax=Pigmentibacter sp. JX0631 TaxID=2976982 RepID=UPI0024686EDD|nr:hypothetical protein [Pigmentibacter sp. JX0631]WGL60118.1 hypothetical protein QEJ31_00685 [Pigmentibacter sp. JX0631]
MKQLNRFCFFILFISYSAFAQRGKDSIQQSAPTATPLSMFAGYFDTGMVPKNRFTFDLPLTGVDYGVSENFTLGANSALGVLTLFTLQPFLYLKARYRFFSNKDISSVITGYASYVYLSPQGNNLKTTLSYYNFTNNTSYFFNSYNILTFHLTALNLNLQSGEPQDLKYYKLSVSTVAFGFGYQLFFNDYIGIEGQFLYAPFFRIGYDDPGQQISLDYTAGSNSIPYFGRFLMNIKTGKESNLNFGFFNLSDLIYGPWLGWQVLF